MRFEPRYAKTDDGLHIAYCVIGDGALDIVYPEPFTLILEYMPKLPPMARFVERLGSLGRLILLDPRGVGLSDRPPEDLPTLESRMADITAVMDAVESRRAVLFGFEDAGMLGALYAATYPERVAGLVLWASEAAARWRPDYPIGTSEEFWNAYLHDIAERWGQQAYADDHFRWAVPSLAHDASLRRTWASLLRVAASPGSALAVNKMIRDTDVRHVLPSVQAPTLAMNRRENVVVTIESSRYMAERIPGALFAELPGADHPPWAGDTSPLFAELERFLALVRDEDAAFDRVLATILCTDIVASTAKGVAMGDAAWCDVLAQHDQIVRGLLGRFRGREIKTVGDGFLATFDGPARAVRCALAISEAVQRLGIEVRAGLQSGEVEAAGDDIRGVAVNTAARVAVLARSGEVLVSRTVKDLVAGSGLSFEDRGSHTAKGLPEPLHLYAAC